ncbi:cytochrome P450 [Mortierella sp. GBAus27b]|nr:cytochrome P450 [Mortierella sp. GBAus27b]
MVANYEKYGNVYTITLPGVGRVVNIRDPEMVDHMLRVNFWAYEKGPRVKQSLYPLVGEGIFGADGEHWKWQRKLASNIFSVKAFRHYTSDVFCHEGEMVINYLNKVADAGKTVDLQQIFYCYTLDSFGEIAFGKTFGCLVDPEQPVEFAAAFDRLNHCLSGRYMTMLTLVRDWWTGSGKQIQKDSKTVRQFALDIIHERRRMQGQQEQDDPSKRDLLQLFMDMSNDGEPLSDDMLVDSVLNFVIAGRDTTAQALSWMFYLMHRTEADPSVREKLVQETEEILKGGHPTYESTKQQKWAESCFYESLRMYPSVPKNIKICVEDDVMPGGVKINKGDSVAWSSWAMGRDTAIWGPDAREYKPERWLSGEKPSSAKFNVFHLGPRTCLGQQFATIEAITIMSMLSQKFTFELVDPSIEPAYTPSLTLPMAKGLPVRVKRRPDNIA